MASLAEHVDWMLMRNQDGPVFTALTSIFSVESCRESNPLLCQGFASADRPAP